MNAGSKKDSYQITLCVTRQAKLLEYLYASFPERSRKAVKSLLEQKQIMIANRIVTSFDYPLVPGMEVFVLKKKAVQDVTLKKMNLLYEDEHLLVIEKSARLLSVATAKENEETAFSILKSYVKSNNSQAQLYIVHRLDRDTSGVMMFAKSKEAQEKLQDNWDVAVTKRLYYAVVEGHVQKEAGEIVSYLQENKSLKMYSSRTSGDGQKAVTRYRVLKSNAHYSLLEVELETGRKNQIRVHLQDMGHSIAGDKKYGALTDPLRRLALHAGVLEFSHPITGKGLHFATPIPAIFKKLFT